MSTRGLESPILFICTRVRYPECFHSWHASYITPLRLTFQPNHSPTATRTHVPNSHCTPAHIRYHHNTLSITQVINLAIQRRRLFRCGNALLVLVLGLDLRPDIDPR